MITADGVAANELASRKLLAFMRSGARNTGLNYRQMHTRCSTHQANLVVQVAVCGTLMRPGLVSAVNRAASVVGQHLEHKQTSDATSLLRFDCRASVCHSGTNLFRVLRDEGRSCRCCPFEVSLKSGSLKGPPAATFYCAMTGDFGGFCIGNWHASHH